MSTENIVQAKQQLQKGEIVQQGAGYKSLIESLRQQPNYLVEKYNEQRAKRQAKQAEQKPQQNKPARAGGVYIPPHKLRAMQQQMLQTDPNSKQHQQMMWELLRKSINGIVNKVNISNIQNVVIELLNQNLIRGKGILARAIIKAQMASPNFTHVYAALIAVINTKLPEIGDLIIRRVMLQFKRSFSRNNKIVCMATTKMLAHLINQRVLGDYLGLQLLLILLSTPTEDSVEIACDFMIQVGQMLFESTPAGASAIFERFKSLLHEGQMQQKAQYTIQNLFAVRKTGFKNHPGVIPQLDLVEINDQITHNFDFEDQLKADQNLNVFRYDPFFGKTEQQWDQIKLEILGIDNVMQLKQPRNYEEQIQLQEQVQQQKIQDLTEQNLINLRRTIYLAIQSTVNFQECAHKILKMNIAKGYEGQLVDMIIECSMMERIYQDFFGLLAERFCTISDLYKELFIKAFVTHYNSIFKQEANKIRNLGKLFGHLFYTKAIDWKIFQIVTLKPDTTTAASRMFLKLILREIVQHMGIQRMDQQFKNEQMAEYFQGLFPIDHPNNVRFAINYYTSIGLGKLTESLREVLQLQESIIAERKQKEQRQRYEQLMREQEELLRLADIQEQKFLEQERIKQEQHKIKKEAQKKQQIKQAQKRKKIQHAKSSSSSSSSSQSSSSSSDRSRKRQKGKRSTVQDKNRRKGHPKSSQSSSGISQSSWSNSAQKATQKATQKKKQVKKPAIKTKNYRSKSRSSSSSSSSSESLKGKNTRNKKTNEETGRRETQRTRNKRDRKYSSDSSRDARRRRSRERR